jgi:hypothetical protein
MSYAWSLVWSVASKSSPEAGSGVPQSQARGTTSHARNPANETKERHERQTKKYRELIGVTEEVEGWFLLSAGAHERYRTEFNRQRATFPFAEAFPAFAMPEAFGRSEDFAPAEPVVLADYCPSRTFSIELSPEALLR